MSNRPGLERGPVAGPLMALFCLVVGGVVAAISYSLFDWQAQTGTESFLRILTLGAFLTLTLFTVVGFIWALFAPRWIARLVQSAYVAVLVSVGLLTLTAAGLLLYFRFTR